MKPHLAWKALCWLLCPVLLAACSDDEQADPLLPPLVWPHDVATAIPDPVFRSFCVKNYDTSGDGRLSPEEVLAATYMSNYNTRQIRSMEGIEYFRNLEKLYWGECNVPSLDLRYNVRLENIRFSNLTTITCLRGPVGYAPLTIEFMFSCNLKELDLSGSGNVRELLTSAALPDEVTLTSVNLPDPSHLQYLDIAAVNAACYDVLLARAVNLEALYCNFYPDAVLDVSHCPKLEKLSIRTVTESALAKIRIHKNAPIAIHGRDIDIRNEKGTDCSSRIEFEYVE